MTGPFDSLAAPAVRIAEVPTPVERFDVFGTATTSFWVKRDDLTHPLYGGNKVRKLERIFATAKALGRTRIVTVGALGSHHVLATTVHGTRAGFAVEAALVAQPVTDHVIENLRASLAQGLVAHPCRTWSGVPWAVLRRLGRDALYVPPGGSNVDGALGYVDAARELAAQIRGGLLPEPDLVYVTLGSGGTAAGIGAGFDLEGLRSKVVAVGVASPPFAVQWSLRRLYRQVAKRVGVATTSASFERRFDVDWSQFGAGYGHATPACEAAIREAHTSGLELDATYTGKTFAAARARVSVGDATSILFWHTLSASPRAPLLASAPSIEDLRSRPKLGPLLPTSRRT
ncbi:MAG: pyridoxal-phosphate dependent enzyme [Polyangiaceae bacterium]